jgi:hypothetical protein
MMRLRSFDSTPPGGFPYVQTEGIHRTFPSVPLIEDQAKRVAAFRRGNKLPRATVSEALDDVSTYTCARLGAGNAFCSDTDIPFQFAAHQGVASAPCAGCGAKL